MNLPCSPTTGTAFDAFFDDDLYFPCLDTPSIADNLATQLCEAPSDLLDPIFDASAALCDLPSDFLLSSLEASADAFPTVALQILPPAGASPRRASSTPLPGSDKSLNSPSCRIGLDSLLRVSTDVEPTPKCRTKKRGRPEIDLTALGVADASAEDQRKAPNPHKKAERKYREGLNAKLERLRRAVPTLLQSHSGNGIGQPKPSKSMVIAAAINHIEMVIHEHDMLQNENDQIREYRTEIGEHREGIREEIGEIREEMGEIRKEKSGLKGGRCSKKQRVGPCSE